MTKKRVKKETYGITHDLGDKNLSCLADALKLGKQLVKDQDRTMVIWRRVAIIRRKDDLEVVND